MTTFVEEIPRITRIVDRLDVRELMHLIREHKGKGLVSLITPTEVDLFREYAPSTYHRIRTENPELKLPPEEEASRKRRLALQVQSELSNKASTIDAAIVHDRFDRGTVQSKVYQYNRICGLFSLLGLNHPATLHPSIIDSGQPLGDILIQLKLRFAELLRDLPEFAEPLAMERRIADLSSEQKEKYSYVNELRSLLGNNLVAIAAYGSSTRETDQDRINDYDNYVVVKSGSLEEVLLKVRGKKFAHPKDGKHVGVNIVEAQRFAFFNRMNHDPSDLREQGVVLHGEIELPIPSLQEIKERGASYAVLRGRTLKAAASWVGQDPRQLLGKPALYDFFQKTKRFIVLSGLVGRIREGEKVRRRDKEILDRQLEQLGARVSAYVPNEEYIFRTICLASVSAARLLDYFYRGKKFEANFIQVAA